MKTCKHASCGEVCKYPPKEKKRSFLKRTPIKKKPYRIKQNSEKRTAVNKVYSVEAAEYRLKHIYCQIKAPGCTVYTQGVHHRKGKDSVEMLLNKDFWMPACNSCNRYVEQHDAWARENGFKLSKHSKNEQTNNSNQ